MEPSEGWGDAIEEAVGIDAEAEGLADCHPGVGTHPNRHGDPVVVDGHAAGVREKPTDASGHLDARGLGRGVRSGGGRSRPAPRPPLPSNGPQAGPETRRSAQRASTPVGPFLPAPGRPVPSRALPEGHGVPRRSPGVRPPAAPARVESAAATGRPFELVVVDGHSAGGREQPTDACGHLDRRGWGRGGAAAADGAAQSCCPLPPSKGSQAGLETRGEHRPRRERFHPPPVVLCPVEPFLKVAACSDDHDPCTPARAASAATTGLPFLCWLRINFKKGTD